jgi:anti-sigma factor RsiW
MSAYLDADLAARPRRRLERHLAECSECRRLIAGLAQVVDALHLLDRRSGKQDALRIASAVRGRLGEPPGG